MPTIDDFFETEIRIGTVLQADIFKAAKKPAIKLLIDFGPELGLRRSSAQLTVHYSPDKLVGRQIAAAVNIGERNIAGFISQVLVLGALPEPAEVVLLSPDHPVPNGTRVGCGGARGWGAGETGRSCPGTGPGEVCSGV
jgi:tRNA-binding protein